MNRQDLEKEIRKILQSGPMDVKDRAAKLMDLIYHEPARPTEHSSEGSDRVSLEGYAEELSTRFGGGDIPAPGERWLRDDNDTGGVLPSLDPGPAFDVSPTRTIKSYDLGTREILELVQEAMKAKVFIGGQPSLSQGVECYAHHLHPLSRIVFSVTTDHERI